MACENCRGGGHTIFHEIISLENLFCSWREFKKGKEGKRDVQEFALSAEESIFKLHENLKSGNFKHGHYTSFYIQDPKLRHIHKASVLDRILHHAVVRVIEPLFDPKFIYDSYSSRKGKGTHKAIKRLRQFAWQLSRNDTKTVWVLQCDIRKFFDSVDHNLLTGLIGSQIHDEQALDLICEIIVSYGGGKGIPLGNVISQLFSNIYLNEFDQFVKNKLRAKHYIRYADDFVILSRNPEILRELIKQINHFLDSVLKLQLHPDKISLKKWHQGIDFLGYVSFPHYCILRTKTKRRALRKAGLKYAECEKGLIDAHGLNQSVQSYLGILKHCRGHGISEQIRQYLKNIV